MADTLSALLQDRPYRKGTGFEAALEELERCAGSQFDPEVVGVLLTIREKVREYFLTGAEVGKTGKSLFPRYDNIS